MSTQEEKNLKIIYETKLRYMPAHEFKRWLDSKEGLEEVCAVWGWNSAKCGREMAELTRILEAERMASWEECCENVWECGKVKFGSLEMLGLAEKLSVRRSVPPPHWRAIFYCHVCGYVLVSYAATSCPWCQVLGENVQAARRTDPLLRGKVSALPQPPS